MKQIVFDDEEMVSSIAEKLNTSRGDIVTVAFRGLGRFLTVDETLSFEEVRTLATAFGVRAVRRSTFEPD